MKRAALLSLAWAGAIIMAAPLAAQMERSRQATAKILVDQAGGGQVTASGFLFGGKDAVVTCLHVVADAEKIEVVFEGEVRRAQVHRVLQRADLVSLKLDRPVDREPLGARGGKLAAGQRLVALGYPLSSPVMRSVDCRVRAVGGSKLSDVVGEPKLRDQIAALGYPALSVPILDLEASLVPGLSGCPILDEDGRLVGIGNGGLEQGFSELVWAVAVSQLDALPGSDDDVPRSAAQRTKVRSLFGAELRAADTRKTIELADGNFTKMRTRRVQELLAYTDDQLGLAQIQQQFQHLSPHRWEFDVYRDIRTGAMFCVPADAVLDSHGDDIAVEMPDSLEFYLRYVSGNSTWDLQAASSQFETDFAGDHYWVPNPQWSYLAPLNYPSGLSVRRKSFVGMQPSPNPWMQPIYDRYLFETFALRDNKLLSVMTINSDLARLNYDEAFATKWGQAVISVQLATFTPSVPEE